MAVQSEASKEGLILPPYQVWFTAEHYIAMAKKMSLKVAWVHLAYNVVDAVLTFPTEMHWCILLMSSTFSI